MHGVGTTVNVGLGVYNWSADLNKDVNKKGSNVTEKVADSSIDTAKNGEQFIVTQLWQTQGSLWQVRPSGHQL